MGSGSDTRNFGMRRFTNLVREGRLRAPATALRLGILVEQDPSAPGYVREADDTAIGGSVVNGSAGILWYEHDSQTYNTPAYGRENGFAGDLDHTVPGRLCQVLQGKGVKVWYRNTGSNETEPGLNFANTRPAVTMVAGLGSGGVVVGDWLGWNSGTHQWAVTTELDEAFLHVTHVDDDFARLDAVLLH